MGCLRVNSNYHNRVADLNFLSAINSPAAFQPADLGHLTLGGNSPFALSVPPRPLAAKLINLEARNYLLFKSTLGNL